jgi:hypothetical protein
MSGAIVKVAMQVEVEVMRRNGRMHETRPGARSQRRSRAGSKAKKTAKSTRKEAPSPSVLERTEEVRSDISTKAGEYGAYEQCL